MKKTIILTLLACLMIGNLSFNPVLGQVSKLPVTNSKEKPVENISLSNHIKQYPYQYLDTFIATLAVLSKSKITVNSYNTAKGQIKARLEGGKGLFIVVVSPKTDLTLVRITPVDGIYDIPAGIITRLFEDIKLDLVKYQ